MWGNDGEGDVSISLRGGCCPALFRLVIKSDSNSLWKSSGIGKREENHAKPSFQQIRFLLLVLSRSGNPGPHSATLANPPRSASLVPRSQPHLLRSRLCPPSAQPGDLAPPSALPAGRPGAAGGRLGAASSAWKRAARARRGGVRRVTTAPSLTRRRTARNYDTELPPFDGRRRRRFGAASSGVG